MAYFPNGTAGEAYEAQWCSKCIHGENYRPSDGKACPIWDAHMLYSYDLCNKTDDPGKVMLDMLIPVDGVYAGECRMFVDASKLGVKAREDLWYEGPPIPDTPHGWMLKFCRHDNERLSRPFPVKVDGTRWTAATDGYCALLMMISVANEWESGAHSAAPADLLAGVFARAPRTGKTVSFAALREWASEPVKPGPRGERPGQLSHQVVDRTRLERALKHLDAERVTVRAFKKELEPVFVDSVDWRLCLMPMRCGPMGAAFLAQSTVTPATSDRGGGVKAG